MWKAFKTKTFGKWILSGEHSILRGSMAIAIPYFNLCLELIFEPHPTLRKLEFHLHPHEGDLEAFFSNIVFKALEKHHVSLPSGVLKIKSQIPMGAGLGSSAALCVAVARWMSFQCPPLRQELVSLATHFENYFHGVSSGMDVTVVAAETPMAFVSQKDFCALPLTHFPSFTLHDSGLRMSTALCIDQVKMFLRNHPTQGLALDQQMHQASLLAEMGLKNYNQKNRKDGLSQLQKSMDLAQNCFSHWGLVPSKVLDLICQLKNQGALSAKLTGSGGGGMIVALWPERGEFEKSHLFIKN